MGLTSGDLPLEVELALVEIAVHEGGGGDYLTMIQQAVFARRDELLARTTCVYATVYLGADIEAVAAAPAGEAPRLMINGRRVDIDIVCAGKAPTAEEVDAMERLAEAVVDAREMLRGAYQRAHP